MKGKSEPPILVKESQREESVSELRALARAGKTGTK